MTVLVHLTSSRFYGGPERQMLGLAHALRPDVRTVIVSFREGGCCTAFLDEAERQGIEALGLRHDTPHLLAAGRELTELLNGLGAAVVCCHGYKANLLGRWAARRRQIPAIAVSRGWTAESWRVRVYETIDRFALRWLDHVVCVSEAQAAKVRNAGVPAERTTVIANSIRAERLGGAEPACRDELQRYFPSARRWLVGTAGRLSPEKGFDVLLDAVAQLLPTVPDAGFVLFGDGPLRDWLQQQIAGRGLAEHVVLAGFRADLDRLLPALDLFVLPSFTEGMPNVVLEAMAARLPVVATAVGGTPEVVDDGVTGRLVPAGEATALAERITDVLADEDGRREMGNRGRRRVEEHFTFAAQARKYRMLLHGLTGRHGTAARAAAELQAIGESC